MQPTAFIVTPDGKHAIAGDAVIPFGATPFADLRKMLQDRADGATRGSTGKELMLVEFADLQCPHCKEAQGTMDQLVKDFPNARVVFQSFPIVDLHPYAFKAAAYGYCVQKQKNDAFFLYSAAVFDAQGALTPETGDETLKNAVTKAGLDPAAVDACAATPATKDQVNASIKLAQDAGVEQTPMLAVNGHLLPLTRSLRDSEKDHYIPGGSGWRKYRGFWNCGIEWPESCHQVELLPLCYEGVEDLLTCIQAYFRQLTMRAATCSGVSRASASICGRYR